MTSSIEIIKTKVDVVEEIGLVVALQKAGKALKGLCPFHNERTPSFYVFPETQNWHCFGCHEGGDVFTFVQKQQNLEFRDVLQYLAEKAGVSIEEQVGRTSEEDREMSAAKERLRKLNEEALLWFHQMLLRSQHASQAREYVQSRGMSSETIIEFAIGYAPDSWDALTSYLLRQGYSERELVMGGLAREREGSGFDNQGNGIYDYFRNRIIFPIRDMRGRVIGFGGRALGDGKPKYLNSPQTLLFEKNSVLYAIDMARDAIKQAKQVVIVEGYVDAVIAHQYGTRQTVACIGSAITEKHIQQLKKLTKQVTLALDPDAAGSAATEHGIQEALRSFDRTVVPVPLPASKSERQETFTSGEQQKQRNRPKQRQAHGIIRLEEQVDAEINVLQLPAGEDPDELIRRDFSSWLYAVSHPLPLIDYYFVVKTAELDLREPTGKAEAAKRLLPVIGMLSDRIKRDAYLRKLASLISIDERSLHEELQRVLHSQRKLGMNAQFSAPGPRPVPSNGESQTTEPVDDADLPIWASDNDAQAVQSSEIMQRQQQRGGLDRSKRDKLQWEDYLIGLLVQYPGLNSHVCGIINDGDFAGTDTRELYHILNSVYQRASSPSYQPVEEFVPSALLTTVARVQKRIGSGPPKDGVSLVKEAVQCATRIRRTSLLQLNTELKYLLLEASKTGDMTGMRQLQRQMLDIHQQLRTINSATHLQG